MFIMVFPVFGGITYFIVSGRGPAHKIGKSYQLAKEYTNSFVQDDGIILEVIQEKNPYAASQMKNMAGKGFPVYQNTGCTYYPMADIAYKDILLELEQARIYIFLEYFILADNGMWASILEILLKKVQQGVEVRVIYDDFASMGRLPGNYWKCLEKQGIKCIAFNPFLPVISPAINNRSHRKMMVIDGSIAFLGGFNLSDEYINVTHPYGVQKAFWLARAEKTAANRNRPMIGITKKYLQHTGKVWY